MELEPKSTVPVAVAHIGGKDSMRDGSGWLVSSSSPLVDSSQCVWLQENTFLVMLAHEQ